MGLALPLTVERQTHLEVPSAEREGESTISMERFGVVRQNEQASHKHRH